MESVVEEKDTQARNGNSRFPFRRLIVPGIFVLALFLVTFFRGRPVSVCESSIWSFTGPTMGTTFVVKVVAGDLEADAKKVIHEAIRGAVDGVDGAMSTYKPQSELSLFNAGGTEVVRISSAFATVLAAGLEVAERSGGAFDPTVGPLVDAWGFGPEFVTEVPDESTLLALRRSVGWEKLLFDPAELILQKSAVGLRLDLSAIAKGFAVDQVLAAVAGLGYEDIMVEIGGEVRTAGRNETGRIWRIGIERPDARGRAVESAVDLSGMALATSGDYRNFREVDGDRISHTIDPRTARPVDHSLASVSVVATTCLTADAWATALNVLGPEEGFAMAEREGIGAYFLTRTVSGFEERATADFPFRLTD